VSQKVRIDKWLWSVRIFKSRTIATDTIKAGKVKVNHVLVKASQLVQTGDRIFVQKNGFQFQFEVINPIEKRVGAAIAQACYLDLTPTEELNKYKDWFVGKSGVEFRERGSGRPTKKERREIDDFKTYTDFYDWDDED
jgi:ribosome-associated heat shock protein Hsp15